MPRQYTTKPGWGPVLTALYRADRFVDPQELAQLSGQDAETVKTALDYLLQQGWIEQMADAEKYACVYQAKAVLASLERSKVIQ